MTIMSPCDVTVLDIALHNCTVNWFPTYQESEDNAEENRKEVDYYCPECEQCECCCSWADDLQNTLTHKIWRRHTNASKTAFVRLRAATQRARVDTARRRRRAMIQARRESQETV